MSLTDAILKEIEALRPALDSATGKVGVHVRAILTHGTIKVTAKVQQYEERGGERVS